MEPLKSKRVPRFVEEYAKDRNGTRAAMRAGYTQNENSAGVTAAVLLSDPRIQALIAEQIEKVSREAVVSAADVLREWHDIATADASKIVYVRRINCRHCHGVGHAYQWAVREYAEACDRAANATNPRTGDPEPRDPPDCSGGFGWKSNAEPNPDCPDCNGEGVEDVFFNDTESLTGPERKLIASIEKTKDGLKIKMRDQDAARANIAKYLGMLVEKRELTGKDGKPLVPEQIPADLPNSLAALGSLYTQIMGG
jgi:phage terminase small subunit